MKTEKMRNYKKISVSYFKDCKSTVPSGKINIWHWLLEEPGCIEIIKEIRDAFDKEVVGMSKKELPCVTFSGIFSKRNTKSLLEHSGLICIDIDGKDNPDISNINHLKKQLAKLPYVLYVGLSVSGNGVFCLIPIAYSDKHLGHFIAIEEEFKAMRINIDPSCKDITRLRFRSYDPLPVINLNAIVYDKYMEGQIIIQTPQKTQKKKGVDTPKATFIQVQEKILSLEEQFLQSMVDNSNRPIQVFHKSVKQKVQEFLKYVIDKQTDITDVYDDWISICIIISQNFGEDGRELFHAISQFHYKYTPEECNTVYDDILNRPYKKSIERLYEIAKKHGL